MSDHGSDSSEAEYVVQVLKDNTLDAVAEYMKSSDCKKVYVMVSDMVGVLGDIPLTPSSSGWRRDECCGRHPRLQVSKNR
jgi:hypothetical protein